MIQTVKGIFISIFNWKFYLACIVIAVSIGYGWHYNKIQEVKDTVRLEVTQEVRLELLEERSILEQDKIKIESKLNKEIQDVIKDKEKTEARLNSRIDDLLVQLQSRQTRGTANTSDVSSNPRDSKDSCTGKELYREDSEFLAREAARADKISLELDLCYTKYDLVKRASDSWIKSKNPS